MKSNVNRIIFIVSMLIIAVVAIILLVNVINIKPTISLQLGSGVFSTRTALNDSDRAQGLAGVTDFSASRALLMVFPSDSQWGIWMKGMKIPLDIVWLNSDKKVIYIVKNASPEDGTSKTFTPTEPARYVVELAAGSVAAKTISVGQHAIFDINGSEVQ